MSSHTKTYNILFLGETQSGKSTFVEHLRKYADPAYVVDRRNIGDSIFSLTKDVILTSVVTSSPAYILTKVSNEGQVRVDYGDFINTDLDDYEDELDDVRTYQLERQDPGTSPVTFNLIDTPGLNDTSLFDETNIAIIFRALASIESVNLIVITISNNPFTEGLVDALKAYINLLPEFNGNIIFVLTRIDYAKLHPKDTRFAYYLSERKAILERLLGRHPVPHLLIDNDIGTKKVVRDCITQNTLRDLLGMAKLGEPVPIQTMRMNKTEKMRHVDLILRDKYEACIKARLEMLGVEDENQRDIMERIDSIKVDINKRELQLKNAREFLTANDSDTLELLHEDSYQQNFSILSIIEGNQVLYYPGKSRAAAPGFVHHVIDHMEIHSENTTVLQEAGGIGEAFWAIRFHRNMFQNGKFHVKIYISRRKKFAVDIERVTTEVLECETCLEAHKLDLEAFEDCHRDHLDRVKVLRDDLKRDRYLLSQVSSTQLDCITFRMLVEVGVYVRDLAQSAVNLEKFYSLKWERLNDQAMAMNASLPADPFEDSCHLGSGVADKIAEEAWEE